MADAESDPEDYDSDSPLSFSAISYSPTNTKPHFITTQPSSDRLYSAFASRRQSVTESEYSPLLASTHRDGTRSYLSTPRLEVPDPLTLGAQRPMSLLTRKISRVFQSKAYDYDSNKNALAAVGSGERVWYFTFVMLGYCKLTSRIGDYRTIDWVHDSVKDQFRKKKLRSMTGFRGFALNIIDSMEGWVLVGLIGTTSLQMNGLLSRNYHGAYCILH